MMLRLYEVTVSGFGCGRVHAKSRSAARYETWLSDAFSHLSFGEFIRICSVRLSPAPIDDGYSTLRRHYPDCCIPSPGTRIVAEGLRGVVLPALRPVSYVVFQPDGQDREAFVHPASVSLEAPEAVQ